MSKIINEKQVLNKYTEIEDLYSYFKTYDNDKIIKSIFDLINKEVDNHRDKRNTKRTLIGFNLISEIIEKNEEIDKLNVQEKLYDLYQEVNKKIKELQHVSEIKDFKKIKYSIKELSEVIKVLDDNTKSEYDLVEYIIFETKNHYYLKNVFHFIKGSVNTKDENNKSIAFNVINEFLYLIREEELSEDVYYLDKVIDIIFSSKDFKFENDEKTKCLKKIYNTLYDLKNQDNLYNAKKNLLVNLKETIDKGIKHKNNIKTIEKKYNIKRGFSREVLSELTPDENYINSRKNELINDYIISIDGKNAIEIDDALSCKKLDNGNYLLGFHNASITSYYDYNSKIVKNAIGKGENIYCGRRFVSIFPTEFSGDKGSLLQGVPRFANSHYIELTHSGEIVDQYMIKSVIKNSNQTTYKEVGNVIVNGCINKNFEYTVNNLVEVAKIIAKNYNKEIFVDHNNPYAFANQIVLFSTLLHNEEVAKFFYYNNYPILYRTDEKNNNLTNCGIEDVLKRFCLWNPEQNYEKIANQILYYDEGAYYASSGAHKGLGLDHYTHFSSPLRRSADIVVERAVDGFYFNFLTDKEKYAFADNLETTIKLINEQNENIKNFLEITKPIKVKTRF